MTVNEARQLGEAKLIKAKIDSHRLDTYLLLEKTSGKSRAWLMSHPEAELDKDISKQFMELISKRAQRIPLVHLTNSREFYGLDFYINEQVLTPRVETEQMVEWAIEFAPKGSRLIDIGTGSGAIAIAIAKYRPDLQITATDVTDEALSVAHQNAKNHLVSVAFEKSDLFEKINGKFDTVVTNLPYLKNDADLMPEVKKEPAIALFGGNDGLGIYRQFLKQLPAYIEKGGYLFTECDPWQHQDLMAEAAKIQLSPFKEGYFILGFQAKQ